MPKDPILKEFCPKCNEYAEKLIEYVRNLENVQIVAKDALQTMEAACKKQALEIGLLQKKVARLTASAKVTLITDIGNKKDAIIKQEQRLANRQKLGVE